jgi:hypothetical protein
MLEYYIKDNIYLEITMINAVIVCHQGIGDIITMSGAIVYLKQFYKKINLICKDKNLKHIKSFFQNYDIDFISINSNLEFKETEIKIINYFNNTSNDIFISGECFNYLKKYKRISIPINQYQNKSIDKQYAYNKNNYIYTLFSNFYNDYNLSIDVYFDYFVFISNENSRKLYNLISNYYIIFIQLQSSDNKNLNITNLLKKYLDNDNVILICNDKNLYNEKSEKYNICKNFIMTDFINYYDTIINANEIYVIDSCFSCIVYPLLITKKLKAHKVEIIDRTNVDKIII